MRIILGTIFILTAVLAGYLQFSGVRIIDNPALAQTVNEHLLEVHREDLANSLNQSLEKESFGNIISRAADLITTQITTVFLEKSQLLASQQGNANVIVHVVYFVEKTSGDPQRYEAWLKFTRTGDNQWAYRYNSTRVDFYLNYLGFE